MAQYKNGTVTVTNGSNVVTGNATTWLLEISVGDYFILVGKNTAYYVASVDSQTQITLSTNIAESSGTYSYSITRDFTSNFNFPIVGLGDVNAATLISKAVVEIDGALSDASASGAIAEAKSWAQHAEDVLVPEGNLVDEYSALHYAAKASADAAITTQDAIDTANDALTTAGHVAITTQDAIDTADDALTTAGHVAITTQDAIDTADDVVLTNADVTTAGNSATEASNWANTPENTLVPEGNQVDEYSAFHWAQKAQSSATGSLIYQGGWDASGGSYPVAPALGDYYKITVAGTMNAVVYNVGDSIICNDAAGSGTWDKIDNTDLVSSVAGKVGTVTLEKADITDYDTHYNWLDANGTTNFSTAPTASGANAIAIGSNANAPVADGVAIGRSVDASGRWSVGIGLAATASADETVAVGDTATATVWGAIAVGYGADASGHSSTAIGVGNSITPAHTSTVLIGSFLSSTAASQVRMGSSGNILEFVGGKVELTGASAQFVQPNYATTGLPAGDTGGTVYDTTTNELKVYTGSSWDALSSKDYADNNFVSKAGDTMTGNLSMSSAEPRFILEENDASADNGRWDIVATNEQFGIRAVNDADNVAGAAITIERTGITIDNSQIIAPSTPTTPTQPEDLTRKDYVDSRVLSGSVTSTGTLNGGSAGVSSSASATGIYTITHNLGHTNYSVAITSTGLMSHYRVTFVGTTVFQVQFNNPDATAVLDTAFHFQIALY